MKPILVHIHIYYPELWPVLKKAVLNIFPYDFDLYVTTIDKNEFLREDIIGSFPNAHFLIVDNLGYDVGPFIDVLNSADLKKYDYIVKLHTKRDMPVGSILNGYDVSGSKWRDYAMEFISERETFKQTLEAFANDENLGMVTNYRLIMEKEKDDKKAEHEAEKMLANLGLKSEKYGFVAGSIFMCRAALLKPLKNLKIQADQFEKPDAKHRTSTLAHTIERLFGLLVLAQKKTIRDVFVLNLKNNFLFKTWQGLKRFIYFKKENGNGKIKIKICKIPVFVYSKKK